MPAREHPRESIDDLDALLGALPPEIVEAVHRLPDRADAMEGPLDAGAVVVAEGADVLHDERDVLLADLAVEQAHLGIREAALGPATQVHHHLDQGGPIRQAVDGLDDLRRECAQQGVEIVDRFTRVLTCWHASLRYRTPAGTRAGSATRTRVSFIRRLTLAIESKPASSRRRSIGDS